ncbi:MAG: tetratricopeptide repeat protein [Opitutaceae bacterium]
MFHQTTRCLNRALFCALIATLTGKALFAQSNFATDRLLKITQREESIYKKIAEDPEFYTESDLQRRIEELVQSYRTYLTDNPNDVDALILYGKLLRRVDQTNQAFTAFLKADELDPEIAVVKQQIGTHLAEQGKGKAALTFYLAAVELEPETALYHFSLGQLLYQFRDEFLEEGIFTRDAIDRETVKAFRTAVKLEPENFDFQMRLGEAYYDQSSPDWKSAHLHWNQLRKTLEGGLRGEIVDLHRARVLGKLGRIEEAKEICLTIQLPNLQFSRQRVIDEIEQY